MQMLLPTVLSLVLLQHRPTLAHSSGAPESSCGDMVPRHRSTTSQSAPSPYSLVLPQTSYKPGERIEVALQAAECAEPFKGFLLEARLADPALNTTELLGEFEPVPGTNTLCTKADDTHGGLTHSAPEPRRVLKVTWKSPIWNAGHVVFKATFVQSYTVYWTAVTSAVLYHPTAPPLSVSEGSIVTPTLSCVTTDAPSISTIVRSGKISIGSSRPSTASAGGTSTSRASGSSGSSPSGSSSSSTSGSSGSLQTSGSPSRTPSMIPSKTPFVTQTGTTAMTKSSVPIGSSTAIPLLSTDYFYSSTNLPSTQHTSALSRELGCQTSLGCFDDCVTNCTFTVSWQKRGDNMYFRLRSVVGGNAWMAVGFSADTLMGNDSITECVSFLNRVRVYQSFNNLDANERLSHPDMGLSEPKGSFNNGIYECSFLRQVVVAGEDRIFSLQQPWHVMFARGTALPGFWKMPHSARDRWVTDRKIDLEMSDPVPTSTVSTPQSKLVHSDECGSTQGCFDDCATKCSFSVSWVIENNNIRFRLKSYQNDGSWMAVGFSDDQLMGDDIVSECVIYGGKVRVFNSHNVGFSNKRDVHPQASVSDVVGSTQDGVFECSFLREITTPHASETLNLSRKWYLMYAQGNAYSDFSIQAHNVRPMVTSSMVDFRRHASLVGTVTSHPLVLAHGSLMCIAWLLFASVGLILARYFKPLWPDSTLGGVKIWFQVHRICMTLTFLLTAAAFIIIFIQSQGYSQILGETYQKSHPILGIIVTGLVIINPVMAYFRPGPKSEKRTVFNWAHFLVGTGGYILAVITIFFGMELSKSNAPSYMKYVLVGYVVWQLLIEFTLEILECRSKQKESPSHDVIQMQNPTQTDKAPHQPPPSYVHFSQTKQLILCVHVFVVTGVTAAVVYILVAL